MINAQTVRYFFFVLSNRFLSVPGEKLSVTED